MAENRKPLIERLRAEAATWDSEPDGLEAVRAPHYIMREAAEELDQVGGAIPVLQATIEALRGALVIAAERLRVAASRVDRADTEFGLRQWAEEAERAALSSRPSVSQDTLEEE